MLCVDSGQPFKFLTISLPYWKGNALQKLLLAEETSKGHRGHRCFLLEIPLSIHYGAIEAEQMCTAC